MPGQGGQERAFAAEEHGLEVAGHLDVVADTRREGDQASGVDSQGLTLQMLLDDRAARVDEDLAVALQPLQDEPLAAEESGSETLLEGDADTGALGRTEKGVFLAKELAAVRGQIHRDDLAGIGRREGDMFLALSLIGEVSHEDGLTRQGSLAHAEQLVQRALVGHRPVTHMSLEVDAVFHVVHRARLGDHRLTGVELDLDDLHVVAVDLVVDFMALHWIPLSEI